jgi:hypothetical protein
MIYDSSSISRSLPVLAHQHRLITFLVSFQNLTNSTGVGKKARSANVIFARGVELQNDLGLYSKRCMMF